MENKESFIGKNLICGRSGIGTIIDVTSLEKHGELFYKVDFARSQCINYFSTDSSSHYRILASKRVLSDAIKIFNTEFKEASYASTQEKINTQMEELKANDVIKLAQTLSALNREKQIHPQISKPYKDVLKTFIDEIMYVLEYKKSEAYEALGLELPVKKPDKKRGK